MFTAFLPLIAPALLSTAGEIPVQRAAQAIHDTKEYTLRITAPGVEKTSTFRYQAGDKAIETSWGGWRILPYILPLATAGNGKGAVQLSFEFPGRKDPIVLHSKGLAEDVYLLRHLGCEKEAEKWLDKMISTSKMVTQWPEKEAWAGRDRLEKVPAELAAAVKLGQEAYEANRPELMRRFNQSYLLYPKATTKDWSVSTGKDTLSLETGCSDRMYFARIRVELKKTDKGDWEVVRILAGEFFKGE